MRYLYYLQVATLFVTSVHCISYSDFPECAQKCIHSSAAQLGGSTDDLTFTCKSSAFLDAVHTCEAKTCTESDISRIFTSAIQLCEPVGGANSIGLGNLSSCAQPGLAIATTESGCSTTNWTCICTSTAYTIIAAEYEEQYCSPADRQAILDYTSTACAAVRVPLEPASPNAPSPTSSARSVYDFPECARPCVDASLLQSGCQPSDWGCICVNPAFISGEAALCELQSCDLDDQYRILNITGPQCSAVGEALVPVTTFPPSPSASATFSSPLEPATVLLVFPTGNVPGSVQTFSDLPTCSQFCAINATRNLGLGGVDDLNLICKNELVRYSLRPCESALCSHTDLQTVFALSQKLCEPVGGVASIGPTLNSAVQASVISAAYPTSTAVDKLDDVPPCAKPCLVSAFNESGCALEDIHCQCTSTAFANLFADCQAAVCSILDLQKLFPFIVKRCGSIGISNNTPSILSVESDLAFGIPTSTDTLPIPTDLSNAPNDIASLPACAQECIADAASFAGCSIHNLTCICTSQSFNAYVGTCETSRCTADELQVTAAYATALCLPVPGGLISRPSGAVLSSLLARPTYTSTNSTLAGTGARVPPTATSFTGDAATTKLRFVDYIFGMTFWLVWVP